MSRPFLSIALGLLLIGCGGPGEESDLDSGEAPGATYADSLSGPGDVPAAGGAEVVLALEGEGLRVFNALSGAARPIPFGSAMDSTLDILRRVQGVEPREQGENPDCGAHYATWEGGLTTWFDDDRFVGWSVRDGDGTLTTATGVGLGSTRAEWESSYVVQQFNSTLGVEFTAGEMAGLFESGEPDARVVNLWAGHVCIAR